MSRPSKLDPAAFSKLLSVIPEEFFKQRDFNPFAHYDDDSNELTEYAEVVELGIEKVVSVHGKALNSATATFTRVLDTFSQSQTQLNQAHSQLQESRDLLNGSGSSSMTRVAELWATSAKYDACVDLLKKLEFVTQAPSLVTELKQSNQYLHSVVLLNQTLAYLNDEDLREIDGLIDLREQMLEDKNTLVEELTQQIHNIIYHPPSNSDQSINQSNRHDESARDRDESVSSAHRRDGSHHRTLSYGASLHGDHARNQSINQSINQSFKDPSSPSSKADHHRIDDHNKPVQISSLAKLEASPLNPFIDHPSASMLDEERALGPVISQRPSRFLLFLVAACDHLNALPSVRTQLTKRMKSEISSVIERELQAVKQSRGTKPNSHKPQIDQSKGPEHCVVLDSRDTSNETEAALTTVCSRVFPALLIVLKHHIDLAVEIMSRAGDHASIKSADPRFGVAPVWETMQIALQMFLLEFLQVGPAKLSALSVASVNAVKKNAKSVDSEITFSFEDARLPSIVKMSRGQDHQPDAVVHDQDEDNEEAVSIAASLVSPSPYHLVTLYRPLVAFINQSQAMMSSLHSANPVSSQLKDFLSVFLMTSFIPRVQADVNRALDAITNDPRAFLPVPPISQLSDASINLSSNQSYVIRCVVSLVSSVRALIADMTRLPHSVSDILGVLDSVIDRFVQRCSDRISELTRGSFSANSLLDPRLLETARTDPAFAQFQQSHQDQDIAHSTGVGSYQMYFSKTNALYAPFLDGSLILKRNQLIEDPVALEQLGLMSESFEWLADQLFALTQRKNNQTTRSARASLINQSNFNSRSLISSRASEWCRWCLALSDRCLINLRFELHCRSATGLAPMILSNYYTPSGPAAGQLLEPEAFILALNADLTKFDDAASAACSKDRLDFIYAGLFDWLAADLTSSIGKLREKRVSSVGRDQIMRNIQSLQQQATNLTHGSPKSWDALKQLVDYLVEEANPADHVQLSAEHASILAQVRLANRGRM